MIGALGIFTLDQLKDVVISRVFGWVKRLKTCETDVRVWQHRREIPVLGWVLRMKAKPVRGFAAQRNRQAVRMTCYPVNSKSFEHLVAIGFTRAKFRWKPRVKPTRHTLIQTRVTVLS